jgi:hypothetical protein
VVTLQYDNDTSEDIPIVASMLSGYDSDIVGTQTITVTYGIYTATFGVTVTDDGPVVEVKASSVNITGVASWKYDEGGSNDVQLTASVSPANATDKT